MNKTVMGNGLGDFENLWSPHEFLTTNESRTETFEGDKIVNIYFWGAMKFRMNSGYNI